MSVNHKKIVKLAASYSLSCDGWVPVKVADWNFFIDSVNELTEENARLRELVESMLNMNMELINDHNKRVPPWDCIDMEHIHDGFKLLKGDEDE